MIQEDELRKLTKVTHLVKEMGDKIQCLSCAHKCVIPEGRAGICKVRYNKRGRLYVPHGYFGALQCDPIEKKPFFHALPGTMAMSYGMLGCDLKCGYCQNWDVSQTLRDPDAGRAPFKATAEDIFKYAESQGAKVIVSTYNEPLITSEWANEIFSIAKRRDYHTAMVSNGNATEEVLDFIAPVTDFYKVDLKSFNDLNYRSLGANLEKILNGIKQIYKRGLWLEIVTLVVPNFNDSPEELRQIAEFIKDVSPDIPWHITAFHPDYKMRDRLATTANALLEAAKIGYEVGLKYVYAGNRPGEVRNYENTYCHNCKSMLIWRSGFKILEYNIDNERQCPSCRASIPGIWKKPDTSRRRITVF